MARREAPILMARAFKASGRLAAATCAESACDFAAFLPPHAGPRFRLGVTSPDNRSALNRLSGPKPASIALTVGEAR
jgi:hypothetical protein